MIRFISRTLFTLLFLAIVSCVRAVPDNSDCFTYVEDLSITINEAKEVFDSCSVDNGTFNFLSLFPGQIAPLWNESVSYRNTLTGQDILECPIESRFHYVYSRREGSRRGRQFLDATQKMLVIKDYTSGIKSAFILRIIADTDYSDRHKKEDLAEKYHNNGVLYDFSGWFLYTELSGRVVRLDRVNKGSIINGVSFVGCPNQEIFRSKVIVYSRLIKELSVLRRRGNLIYKTKSDGDPDSLNYDPNSLVDTLEAAICVDSLPVDDDGFDPWGDYWDEATYGSGTTLPLDPGSGGGGGSGSGMGGGTGNGNTGGGSGGQQSLDTLHLGGLTIIGETDKANNMREYTLRYIYKPIPTALISRIDTSIIKIIIKPVVYVNGIKSDGSATASGLISIQEDFADGFVFHELFHVYQYSFNDSWSVGDLEFEARVFDAIMMNKYGMYYKVDWEKLAPFYNFYCEMSESSFQSAITQFRSMPFFFSQETYPISAFSNYEEYVKHIIALLNHVSNSEL